MKKTLSDKIMKLDGHVLIVVFGFLGFMLPAATDAWSKEGHVMTCQIAQSMLKPEAAAVVAKLLPDYANGDLSTLCTWPDEIKNRYKYRWTNSHHFIVTPDNACTFKYDSKPQLDCNLTSNWHCHDPHGKKDMCVAGAIQNYTSQLMHYRQGTSDRRYNMTEALLFLSHFMGDIHQPMHVGYTTDEGGNKIDLRWFRHKSNLHHVWDRDIIYTTASYFYGRDMDSVVKDIKANLTRGIWTKEIPSWKDCNDIKSCAIKYATESMNVACNHGYKGVTRGDTLAYEYFNSRMPLVMRRVAQDGVRLAMFLNRVF